MRNTAIVAFYSTMLSACVATPPAPSEENRFGLEVANQICNIDALAEEKKTILAVANDYTKSVAPYQNKTGSYTENTETIVAEKMLTYEAEIEASYRFVTQRCGAYMRCLERNLHNEALCAGLESSWAESQTRFNELAKEIRLASQKQQSNGNGAGKPSESKDQCCTTLNNVFTDCCD